MLQRTVFGPVGSHTKVFEDLDMREMGMLIPLVLLLLITGIAPSLFIPYFEPHIVTSLAEVMHTIGGVK